MIHATRWAWLLAVLLSLTAVARAELQVLSAQEPGASAVTPQEAAIEARVRTLAARLRCPTCRALSVQDSPSEMALEMRDLIRDQVRAGKTDEEILAYFVDRYGEWILLKPMTKGFNWTVWLLPILMLAGGLVFVILTARRWVEHGQARAAALGEDVEGSER